MYAHPILRCHGGRSIIQPHILSQLPKYINNYYEPFVGTGNVLISLLASRKILGNVIVGDNNPHLITMYEIIRDYPKLLIDELKSLTAKYNSLPHVFPRCPKSHKPELLRDVISKEQYYYWIRDQFNNPELSCLERSSLFIFLNKTCFRGLYREGPHGFNVPYGHYPNPMIYKSEHIQYLSNLLRDVQFERQNNFRDSSSFTVTKKNEDFVFINTPIDFQESWDLYETCKKLDCTFFLCDSTMGSEIIKKIFPSPTFLVSEIQETRYSSIQFVKK
jgi:DNA adenine methylase